MALLACLAGATGPDRTDRGRHIDALPWRRHRRVLVGRWYRHLVEFIECVQALGDFETFAQRGALVATGLVAVDLDRLVATATREHRSEYECRGKRRNSHVLFSSWMPAVRTME